MTINEVQATDTKQDLTGNTSQDTRALLPRVDVLEDDEGITLLADLPGVPKDHLELKVKGDALVIEGVMAPFTPETLEPVYAEVRLPRYWRAFPPRRTRSA